MTGKVIGGVIAFGGGLGLYDDSGVVVGVGASGNTACADHNIAWRVRKALGLDKVKDGPSPAHNDAIIYDVGADGKSPSGWGHPGCNRNGPQVAQQIGAGVIVAAGHDINKPPISATQGSASDPKASTGQPRDKRERD
jgi:hypothetical protein